MYGDNKEKKEAETICPVSVGGSERSNIILFTHVARIQTRRKKDKGCTVRREKPSKRARMSDRSVFK